MLKRLLIPLSWLYGFITDLRNRLYDKRVFTSYRPPVPTICVGNLTVGGTGKTPHVDFLIQCLPWPLATLSRGYGRQTKGFRMAGPNDTADTLGDEPLQLYYRHRPDVTVAVGEKRADAIRQLLAARPKLRTILLDDAFQHRAVRPHINLLLSDFARPFYDDYPFPAGWLRERRWGARRAEAVIITKCPDALPENQRTAIEQRLMPYLRPGTPVFFTGLRYANPVNFVDRTLSIPDGTPVILVTGIARSEPLETHVKKRFSLIRHLRFADHHRYTATDLRKIEASLPSDGVVLTTEKDFVKLASLLTEDSRFFYLPVDVYFLEGEERFRKWINEAVKGL